MTLRRRPNFKVQAKRDWSLRFKMTAVLLVLGGVGLKGALEMDHPTVATLASATPALTVQSAVQGKRQDLSKNPVSNPVVEANLDLPGIDSVQHQGKDLSIILQSDRFFELGSATLSEGASEVMSQIAGKVRSLGIGMKLEIEGHTDDSPVLKRKKVFHSNWELSLARAAAVLHVFESSGFPKSHLKVAGFGDSRPLVPNRNDKGEMIPENLIRNRRIILRVRNETQQEAAED